MMENIIILLLLDIESFYRKTQIHRTAYSIISQCPEHTKFKQMKLIIILLLTFNPENRYNL